ncbi:MAG: hypothetical protein CL930_11485 [Deltaproteobacteria bacterium]|nr:hypothetical protein [Deltaproteobacteria bacterium]
MQLLFIIFLGACFPETVEPEPSSVPSTTEATATPVIPVNPPEVNPPNLVIISLDTVSAERLEVYGGAARTPNLNAFAAGGTLFRQAISPFPETALAHWSMLTGALPAVHGDVPAYGDSRYSGPTLAQLLSKAGFNTAAFIGGETLTNRSTGLARGFQLYDDQYPWDRADLKRPGADVAQAATTWIDKQERQQKPYFAFVHFFDAHFPYTPAPPWDTLYDPNYQGTLTGSDADLRPYRDGEKTPTAADIRHIQALYDGELSELDALLGPLLQALDGRNTLVVITADHGESFGHNYWFNHRDALWDEVIRVPLLIRGPGVPANHQVDDQVSLIDVTPTVLKLLNQTIPAPLNGTDKSGLFTSKAASQDIAFAITDPFRKQPQFASRIPTFKRIQKVVNGKATAREQQAYNLSDDPYEMSDGQSVPERLDKAWAAYQAVLQPVIARWQGPKPAKRTPDQSEYDRLKALGYVDEPAKAPTPK